MGRDCGILGGGGCREKGQSTEPATGPSPAECEPRIAVQQGDDSGAVHSWDTATEGSGHAEERPCKTYGFMPRSWLKAGAAYPPR